MKSSSQAVTFLVFALMLSVLLAPASVGALTCGDVVTDLRPCITYLTNGSGMPPPPCCAGVSKLSQAAATTADRQTACNCLKSASKNLNVKPPLAKALPGNCGISLSFVISLNTDCSKVS